MKQLIALLMFSFVLIGASTSVYSEGQGTPDGVTPANEGVCDVLQGGTPSLYGLCVAFCEAQDHFDENVPVTEEEIDAYLASVKHADKIYEKYNARKTVNDPDMPCIVVAQNECPCWTEEELDAYTDATNSYTRNEAFGQFAGREVSALVLLRPKSERCRFVALNTPTGTIFRQSALTAEEAQVCVASLDAQAVDLGL